jgi:hypothetical protein
MAKAWLCGRRIYVKLRNVLPRSGRGDLARLGRGRRLHAKRMASVAAIYTVERFVRTPEEILPLLEQQREKPTRPQPEHKRVWASLANPQPDDDRHLQ